MQRIAALLSGAPFLFGVENGSNASSRNNPVYARNFK